MTTDRTAAPFRPAHAERPAAPGPSSAASGFAHLLSGAHAASARPAARAAGQPRDEAPQPQQQGPEAPVPAEARARAPTPCRPSS